MTSTDLERRDVFLANLGTYMLVPFDRTDSDQIWHAKPRGVGHVIRGQPINPPPKQSGLKHCQFFLLSPVYAHTV